VQASPRAGRSLWGSRAPARPGGAGTGASLRRMLSLTRAVWTEMVAHAHDGLPDEACGLLAGVPGSDACTVFFPCRNAAASSRVYTIDPRDHLRADREAEAQGLEIIGVMHSHTHTDPFPSATDIAQAPVPDWHYVIVSLRDLEPMLRSYRIVDGEVDEEVVAVLGR
jgi:proteasome lid subunit RPN8/RPN11